MFEFKNIKKFFTYDWKTLIKDIVPKGNKTKMDESEEKNIFNGSILKIIGVVLQYVALMGIAVYIVVKTYSIIYGSSVTSFAFKEAITAVMGKWIFEIALACIFPIAIIVYTKIMKGKEQNGWPIFIILIISVLQIIYFGYLLVSFLLNIAISPLFVIIGLASIFALFLGNIHVSVGCIDFLKKQADAYKAAHPVNNQVTTETPVEQTTEVQAAPQVETTEVKVEPVQQETPVTETPVEPVQQETTFTQVEQVPQTNTVYCTSCGNEVPVGTAYCSKCGNKIS